MDMDTELINPLNTYYCTSREMQFVTRHDTLNACHYEQVLNSAGMTCKTLQNLYSLCIPGKVYISYRIDSH